MRDLWFISDTHFGHANILKFTGDDGQLIRPGFTSVEEMDERIIDNWNGVVKPGDHVWHLGDWSMKAQHGIKIIKRLNGRKRLCVGNHDPVKELAPFFEKVVLWRIFKEFNFTCTHIPMRADQLRKTEFNVHGHIHQNLVHRTVEYIPADGRWHCSPQKREEVDDHYINVCVEHTNCTPIHLDEIRKRINAA